MKQAHPSIMHLLLGLGHQTKRIKEKNNPSIKLKEKRGLENTRNDVGYALPEAPRRGKVSTAVSRI